MAAAAAAVGSEVTGSWLLSSGVVGFFILLLLLSIFLAALCSDCGRRSFELREPAVDKNPSSLIRVVKLEEALGARENPMIDEIQKDETEGNQVTAWRSHLGAPQTHRGLQTNGSSALTSESETSGDENSVQFTPWRSHLGTPQTQGVNGPAPPDPIYHVIGEGRGSFDASSPPANQEGGSRSAATVELSERDRNSVYARVSKKVRLATPPDHAPPARTPEDRQVVEEEQEEEEEEEESSPPLPDRKTQLEG